MSTKITSALQKKQNKTKQLLAKSLLTVISFGVLVDSRDTSALTVAVAASYVAVVRLHSEVTATWSLDNVAVDQVSLDVAVISARRISGTMDREDVNVSI